jgi:8-oxo-dGTP diphosphatase
VSTVLVAAAVLVEGGRVLLTQRKRGTHLEGAWEFPGGKVEPDEDPRDALARELREEIGVEADVGEILDVTFHRYEGSTDPPQAGRREHPKSVLLLFYAVARKPGSPEPRAIDVAALEWGDASALDPARFPPADVAILAKVRALLA